VRRLLHELTPQTLYNAIGGIAIPEIGAFARSNWARQHPVNFRFQCLKSYQTITALINRDGAFGVLAESKTWNAKVSSFLLNR
jgi:hypothetical protein